MLFSYLFSFSGSDSFFICYIIGLGWQRQPSFDQIPEFSLLSTNDGPSTSFGSSSKLSSSSSSSKPSSSRSSSSKPSSRPPRSRPRPSETKSRPSTKPISTNPEDSSAPLNKTNPEQLLDVIKGMKTHVAQKAGVVHPRRNSTAGSVASSSSSTRVGRTSMANPVVAAAAATSTATRKRARHASDGRNSSSDGASHGQVKRGRVVLDKGKARASVDGLEIQKAKEKEKDAHTPPSHVASSSGTASSLSSSGSKKPEGISDTSLSMEVDEGDISLAADRSTRSWTTESPSLLGSSSSLSSAESRSPSQKRMPPPPVPLAAKLLAAKANEHPSRRRSSGGGSGASTRASTSPLVLMPTQKEVSLDSKMVPKLHPLLQNPPTKLSAPVSSHSNSNLHSSGRQTKVNPLPHQAPSRAPAEPGSRQNHNPAVPPPDVPPRAVITVPTSTTTTTKVKTEQNYAKPAQAQLQAPLPHAQPLRSTTSCKPPPDGTSTSTTRPSGATTLTAARTAATNLPSTPHGTTRSQPQHLTLSQSTRPPPLGMRRTNTFPLGGVGSGVGQKTGGLPTKQKGFRVPFMNGGMGSQQQQQQQPSVADSGASKQGGAATSNAPSNSKSNLASSSTASFSAKSKASEQPSAHAVTALAPPPPVSPATAVVPAIELPGPTDGDGDSSFDMSLSFDMDALEETMRLYD